MTRLVFNPHTAYSDVGGTVAKLREGLSKLRVEWLSLELWRLLAKERDGLLSWEIGSYSWFLVSVLVRIQTYLECPAHTWPPKMLKKETAGLYLKYVIIMKHLWNNSYLHFKNFTAVNPSYCKQLFAHTALYSLKRITVHGVIIRNRKTNATCAK